MLHPDIELRFIDDRVGYGLYARKALPRGTIVWGRDDLDQQIPLSRAFSLPAETRRVLEHFAYVDRFGDLVLCWDNGRYMNHSCAPNCGQPGYELEIAVRDVATGEQLVEDYGLNNMDCPWTCLCGAAGCRGRIRHDDFASQADRWDARVAEAFPAVGRVEQALWSRVGEKEHVRAVPEGREQLPSCRVQDVATCRTCRGRSLRTSFPPSPRTRAPARRVARPLASGRPKASGLSYATGRPSGAAARGRWRGRTAPGGSRCRSSRCSRHHPTGRARR